MEIVSSATATATARRSANYKPNIWNYDYLQSLTTKYNEQEELDEQEREAARLREQVREEYFCASKDALEKLEFIDLINKLALSHLFEEEISTSLNEIIALPYCSINLYSAALHFRILRQHGYFVPQDGIVALLDDEEEKKISASASSELFEASHLGVEDEHCLFDRATATATATALANNNLFFISSTDGVIRKNKCHSVKRPSHRSVTWFSVRMYMHQNDEYKSAVIRRLAALSFNTIQLQHQKELNDILRWWRNLGLLEVLTFSRDRVVESFLWAVGVAYEPPYASLRKWLTKAILLVLIIDDVYDIYGSFHELQQFTTAVQRWDPSEIQHLPEAIKKCFCMLYDTANEIDLEIQKEKGWNSVLPHLKKMWTEFCKALLVEAKWYKMGQCPSLTEYLLNGRTSSSGPLLSLHIMLGLGLGLDLAQTMAAFRANQDIIHEASLVIRLCNDQGTFKAEVERGDAASSMVCHMREANVGEREAREQIGELISESWKKMNGMLMSCPYPPQQRMMRYIVNTARVAGFIYQNGDGFGVQDIDTKHQVLSSLIHPLHVAPLSPSSNHCMP